MEFAPEAVFLLAFEVDPKKGPIISEADGKTLINGWNSNLLTRFKGDSPPDDPTIRMAGHRFVIEVIRPDNLPMTVRIKPQFPRASNRFAIRRRPAAEMPFSVPEGVTSDWVATEMVEIVRVGNKWMWLDLYLAQLFAEKSAANTKEVLTAAR